MISGEAAPRPFIKAGAERSGGAGGGGGGAAADMTHFKTLQQAPEKQRFLLRSVQEMTLEDC